MTFPLRALNDSIIFQFYDTVTKDGRFEEKYEGSIYVAAAYDHENNVKQPRRVKVLAVGPNVEFVKVGDDVLVEALRWTEAHKLDGVSYWRTAEKEVIGIFD